eukprot:1147959-Pelagomonas_calceolata.AAC.1
MEWLKENNVGRRNSPFIDHGKGVTLAQKSHESPPPQGYRPVSANGDLEGYWKHPDPGSGSEKYFRVQ